MKPIARKRINAQALVEFALVVPIFLLLVFGIIDFGWVLYNYNALYNSLREGLRYGSVGGYTTPPQYEACLNIRNRIVDLARSSGITPASITIVYDDGTPVQVNYVANTDPPQIDATNSGKALNTSDVDDAGNTRNAMVAYCAAAATTTQSTDNTSYVPYGGSASATNTRDPSDGDRIYIEINANVHFLTPFLNGLWPSGLTFQLRAARSIYPNGLPLDSSG